MDRAGTSPGFKKILSSYIDSSAEDGENSEKETSKKDEEVPSVATTPASRRLRTGKEASAETSEKKSAKKGRGKKRELSGHEDEVEETPAAKRWEKEETSVALKTPTKVVAQSATASTSATKSPVGVNRRNAVLFTRKKQAAAVSTPEPREDDSDDDLENRETEVQSPGELCCQICDLIYIYPSQIK